MKMTTTEGSNHLGSIGVKSILHTGYMSMNATFGPVIAIEWVWFISSQYVYG